MNARNVFLKVRPLLETPATHVTPIPALAAVDEPHVAGEAVAKRKRLVALSTHRVAELEVQCRHVLDHVGALPKPPPTVLARVAAGKGVDAREVLAEVAQPPKRH